MNCQLPLQPSLTDWLFFLIGIKCQGGPFKGAVVKKHTVTGCKEQHVQLVTAIKRQLLILSGVTVTTVVLIPA